MYTSAHHLHPHKHEISTFLACIYPLLVALDSVYQYNLPGTNSKSVPAKQFSLWQKCFICSLLYSHTYLHPSLTVCGLLGIRKHPESLQKRNYLSWRKLLQNIFIVLENILIFTLSLAVGLLTLLSLSVHKAQALIKTRTVIKRIPKCPITFVNWDHQ